MADQTDSIVAALGDTVDEINGLLQLTGDPQTAQQLHCLREIYFDLWEAAVKKQFDDTTQPFKDAIGVLQQSEQAAKDAQADITKVADAIQKAATGAKVADKLFQTGLQVAKYFP